MSEDSFLTRITRLVRKRADVSGADTEWTAPTEVCHAARPTAATQSAAVSDRRTIDPDGSGLGRIGCYELLEGIGRGGMGSVWRAWDHTLQREVALKILDQSLVADDLQRGRFQREARTAAVLSDPAICTVHEFGETDESLLLAMDGGSLEIESGAPFLVMELVEGRTLQEHLASRGRLEIDEVLALGAKIAAAISVAHEKGVVHRDLKPSNIMILPTGDVKILDFGLARFFRAHPLLGGENRPCPDLTTQFDMEGTVVGTVSYMSPEQAQGKKLDERSDLFSLGIMLFEMLSGQRPFSGDTPTGTMAKIIEAPPEPLRAGCPTVPVALASIVSKLLEKQRANRYANAKQLAAYLTAVRDNLINGTKLPRPLRQSRSSWRVVPGIAVALAIGVLAVLAVITWRAGLLPWADPTAIATFVDDFDTVPNPNAETPWEIFHFDEELWNPDFAPGALTLWTHQGDTWNENGIGMKAKNLVGVPVTARSFQVTVKIDDFWPRKDWQQAGLMVFADEDNYVRFTLGSSSEIDPLSSEVIQTMCVQGVFERNDEVLEQVGTHLLAEHPNLAVERRPRLSDSGPVERFWLRIVRDGDDWDLLYSEGGVTFYRLAQKTFPLKTTHVGLIALHGIGRGDAEPDLTWDPIPAKFDFIRLEPLPW